MEGNTREHLRLPPASRPSTIRDQRFSDKCVRWAYCDRCGAYCGGRARDYLYGRFVYGYPYNKVAGPGCRRSPCFPKRRQAQALGDGTMEHSLPTHAGHASRYGGNNQSLRLQNGFAWTATRAPTTMCTVARAARGPATGIRVTGPRQLGAGRQSDAGHRIGASRACPTSPHGAFVARTVYVVVHAQWQRYPLAHLSLWRCRTLTCLRSAR